MGIVIPPIEYVLGLEKYEHTDRKEGDLDVVCYELRKYFRLLLKNNPNVLSLLWLRDDHYIIKTELGQRLIDNRKIFISKQCYKSFCGYAWGQLRRMTHFKFEGYMGKKRKQLVEKFGYDCKNASHLIRLLKMGIELLISGELNVWREDSQLYISIKQGEWTLEQVQKKADELFQLIEEAYVRSPLPNKPNKRQINQLCIEMMRDYYDSI